MREDSMVIVSTKSKMSLGCCMYGFDAEVKVDKYVEGKYETFYVSKHEYDCTCFGVSRSSIFDEDNWEIEFLEEYDNLEAAKTSDFYRCFEIVDRMVDELGKLQQAG